MSKYIKIILVLIATNSFAQEAPKKANTITISSSDDLGTVFSKYEKYLDEEGFILREKEDNQQLQTSAKEKTFGPMSSYSVYVEFQLEFKESEGRSIVTLTGNYMDAGGMAKAKPIINKGSPNFGVGLAWRIMNELAIRYPGGKIIYTID